MADADFDGVTNPNRVVEKRLKKAEAGTGGTDAGELGKKWDDSFEGSGGKSMTQAEFAYGTKRKGSATPPADMLKKRSSKE